MQKPGGSLTEKANLYASLFRSNSRLDARAKQPHMPEMTIHTKEVRRALRSLHVRPGPDGIPARVLRYYAPELSPVLTRLCRLSLRTRTIPKKGIRSDPCNYRPIAITSILCKVMERVLNSKLRTYLEDNDLHSDRQYGFRRGRSTGDLLMSNSNSK